MSDFHWTRVRDFGHAYKEGVCTPLDVANKVLEAVETSEQLTPPMRIFLAQEKADVLQQAQDSTDRFARQQPLGPLDGVPIAVKDELDQQGYPTTVGTKFLGEAPAEKDATLVARLRQAGALLIGKANMHEIGLGVTGINSHHGSARNPYDPTHVTGGSSSGSAAAVAMGLCPVSIGADGGGSIRIPAALCGITGIKATFGRVSEKGVTPLCWSVAHVGPLACCVEDLALALDTIAGPDAGDPLTLAQPGLDLSALKQGVAGLRLGVCAQWWDRAGEPVRQTCEAAVERLVKAGAQVVEVDLAHLEQVRAVQLITIGVEMAASQYEHRRTHRKDYGADSRLLLALASRVPAVDYVRAQRLRSLIREDFVQALQQADILVTPMTATTSPPLHDDAEKAGESDDEVLANLTAFSFPPNLTGQPALSVPVGYDDQDLPIGLQLIGRHWEEATLLRAALAVERTLTPRLPKVHYELLP